MVARSRYNLFCTRENLSLYGRWEAFFYVKEKAWMLEIAAVSFAYGGLSFVGALYSPFLSRLFVVVQLL